MNNLLKKELKATHTQKEDKKRRKKKIKTMTTNKQRNKTYCKKLKGFRE